MFRSCPIAPFIKLSMVINLRLMPAKKIRHYESLFREISAPDGYMELFQLEGTADTRRLKVIGWVPPPVNRYRIDLPFTGEISGPYFEGRMEGVDKSVLDLKNKVIEAYPDASIHTKEGIRIEVSGKAVFSLSTAGMLEGHSYKLRIIENNTDRDFSWMDEAEVISKGYSAGCRLFLKYFYKNG